MWWNMLFTNNMIKKYTKELYMFLKLMIPTPGHSWPTEMVRSQFQLISWSH